MYPRPDSFFIHRPFDGGVPLGTGGPNMVPKQYVQVKNILDNPTVKVLCITGAPFVPSYDLRSCTADGVEVGATITVTCDDNDLGLQIGFKYNLLV